jgi:hypothetical protein
LFDIEPTPLNIGATLQAGTTDDAGSFWSASVGARGTVSVPGFSEASVLVELEVKIENFSAEVLEVTIDSVVDSF